jgi:branched-chain amino acid transport system permease protein
MQLQVILNGVISGLILALVATAFSLVYLPCRVFHIALAGIFALAPYIALSVLKHTDSWLAAVTMAVAVSVAVSLLCEACNHARLERRRSSSSAHLIASLGVYIVLVQVVAIIWGNETQVLRTGIDAVWRLGSLMLTRAQLIGGGVSAVLLGACYSWLRFSKLGLCFRALADNPVEFALYGYNVNRYRLFAFGVSGFLGSVAALLMAYDVAFDPHGGLHVLLLGVVAVIIGGRGSFLGPALGGLLLGVLRAQVVWHFSARWQDVFTFLLLSAFLYARPKGICGHATRLEAEV